ncbi:hypothetical protein TNCV_1868281 [Trichonephila clavipes]|nr:hypothetical protein TNCV_1868281 [Trichonephila clavipes]
MVSQEKPNLHNRADAIYVPGVAFSQCSSSPRLIQDETFNDSDIINKLIDYEDGQRELNSVRVDKNMQKDPAFQQIERAFYRIDTN